MYALKVHLRRTEKGHTVWISQLDLEPTSYFTWME